MNLELLKSIANRSHTPDEPFGLCKSCDIDLRTKECFLTWEHFSGDKTFPVPSGDPKMTPDEYYLDLDPMDSNLWKRRQLEYRISLANHILKFIGEG